MKDPAGNAAPAGGFKTGGWYSGYQYWNGSFAPVAGQFHPSSNQGSGDAPTQSATDASYIQSERVRASQIQAPVNVSLPSSTSQSDFVTGLTAEVQQARAALESEIAGQKSSIDAQSSVLRGKEQQTLGEIKKLTTPFRENLEASERDRLHINQNFEANQDLVNELDSLLTEGNELIRQQKEVTGLAAVRNPRIQKAMDDVAARAGVIEAVINARNGQIAVAENMIDRTANAIAADRQDQIAYYETVLNLNRQDIIRLDDASAKLAQEQLNLKKGDLERAQATVDYVKQLLIDPNTASLMAEGGVKLTDSVEQINQKVSNATYAREVRDLSNEMVLNGAEVLISTKGVPKDELRVLTDSRGVKHYYRVKQKVGTGTESERAVNNASQSISDKMMNFSDAIDFYAPVLSLPEIYAAYNQSEMGKMWGRPGEDPSDIVLAYRRASGEITEAEMKEFLNVE